MQQQQFEPQSTATWTNAPRRKEHEEQPTATEAETAGLQGMAGSSASTDLQLSQASADISQVPDAQASVEQLLGVIERESAQRKRTTRIYTGLFGGIFGLMFLAVAVNWMKTGHFPSDMLTNFASFTGVIGMAAGFSKTQKKATQEIAQFDDIRAVGPMLEALGANDREVTKVLIPALTRLLPRLQASDANLLNAEQSTMLNQLLITKATTAPVKIPDFYAAALSALQQVGDEKSLSTVERLSKGDGMAAYYPELKAQAQETLPFLRQRIEQARASQTLLRASAPAEAAPDTLLRAAAPTVPAANPGELLRPNPSQEV